MCDLICDVTTLAVFKAAMMFFYINLHLKDRLDIEFIACDGELMPQEALTSFRPIPYLY